MNAPRARPLAALGLIAAFVALLALLAIGLTRDESARDALPSPLIGKPAPAFTLSALTEPDRMIRSSDLHGEPWMLNVWASWCGACRIEHETVMRLAQTGQIAIFGLNLKDERGAAQAWLARLGNPYRDNLHDPLGRTAIDFGVYGVPETFLIDRRGIVRYKFVGPLTDAVVQGELLPRIAALRKETQGAAGEASGSEAARSQGAAGKFAGSKDAESAAASGKDSFDTSDSRPTVAVQAGVAPQRAGG